MGKKGSRSNSRSALAGLDIRAEIKRCGLDPVYFITKYVKIKHPVRGLIPFKMFDYQEDLVRSYVKHRFNVVLKARQLGISEVTAAYAAWLMLFRREKNVLVIASKAETAKNIIRKIETSIKKLPSWLLLADIVVDNRLSLELSNGSRAKAIATSDDAGRSEAVSFLIIDEAAFVPRLDELWAGLYSTVAAGGCIAVLSTPNGVGNKFHSIYTDGEQGLNEFKTHRFMWWLHPERQEGLRDDPDRPGFKTSPWFENETRAANMSPRDIASEYECVVSDTVITVPNGGKKIQDVKVGDLVLTHKGRFRKVTRTFTHRVDASDVVTLSLPLSRKRPISITRNHPLAVCLPSLGGHQNLFENVSNKHSFVGFKSLDTLSQMTRREDVTKSFLAMISPVFDKTEIDGSLTQVDLLALSGGFQIEPVGDECVRYFRQKGSTQRFVPVDYDLGKLIGLYLAEGCTQELTTGFSFHRDESDLIGFVSSYLSHLGMKSSVHPRSDALCTTISSCNKFLKMLLSSFVSGTRHDDKLLRMDVLLQTNVQFIKGVVDGIWLGDGLHVPAEKNTLSLKNENLIRQIRVLMTMFGMLPLMSPSQAGQWMLTVFHTDGKTIDQCTTQPPVAKKQSRSRRLSFDGFDGWWAKSSSLQPYTGHVDDDGKVTVFNIEVEDDNSYVVEGNLVVHNCNFNASGDTVITSTVLSRLHDNLLDPVERRNWDRNLWIWSPPVPGTRYLVSADVARGDGKDFSAAHVWDARDMVQVAEYCGRIPTEDFAKLLCELGREYNQAMLIVENNSVGLACIEHIRIAAYTNVYYSRRGDTKPGDAVNTAWGVIDEDLVPGFTMSPKVRPLLVDKFEEYIRNKLVLIRSRRFHEELKTFIWNSGRAEAARGFNDDLTMAAAIGVWIRETFLASSLASSAMNSRLLGGITVRTTSTADIPGASTDPRMSRHSMVVDRRRQLEAQLGRPGEPNDFSWLIRSG